MKKQRLLAAVLCSAFSLAANAQTIAAPADSKDSSVRARVAITPVDTSQFATTSQLNNVSSVATNAYFYGYNSYINQGYNKPWTQWFVGQLRAARSPRTGYTYYVNILSDGTAYWCVSFSCSYSPMGAPIAGASLRYVYGPLTSALTYDVIEVLPTYVNSNGVPADWKVVVTDGTSQYGSSTNYGY